LATSAFFESHKAIPSVNIRANRIISRLCRPAVNWPAKAIIGNYLQNRCAFFRVTDGDMGFHISGTSTGIRKDKYLLFQGVYLPILLVSIIVNGERF
jgi:hypothetical protein